MTAEVLLQGVVGGLLMGFVNLGLALQATAQDKQAAALMGIDTERMFALGWGLGAGCVGVAGALLATFFYIFPDVGATFALPATSMDERPALLRRT